MANLRDVRLRMRSITQTLKVTKAMYLISTAKLRKGRRQLEDTVHYFNRIKKCMVEILSGAGNVKSEFFRKNNPSKSSRTAIVAINSDRGLAGAYNANIHRQVEDLCARVKNPILILVGEIGYRLFAHSSTDESADSSTVILENFSFGTHVPGVSHAQEIADYIVSHYLWGMFDEVHIVYTHMYSSIKLSPTELQILPLNIETLQKELALSGIKKREKIGFEYLPSKEEVFDKLAPLYIKGIIYGALVEAYASEQSARMSAMDEASKNAEEMLGSLRIRYNRARQAGITQEMTEIVGGDAAMKG